MCVCVCACVYVCVFVCVCVYIPISDYCVMAPIFTCGYMILSQVGLVVFFNT